MILHHNAPVNNKIFFKEDYPLNADIKEEAKRRGVNLWRIADALGINDGNLSRKLRHELPAEEKEEILAIIDRLAGGASDA